MELRSHCCIFILFNYIIENRKFPTNWAEGLKTAIYKHGDKTDANNYRGINVPKIFEKLFEILVYNRMQFINEAFSRVDQFNGGFLQGRRTSDNIFILNGLIQKQILLNKPLYICFVDFSKAFDLVNRHILFYKLMKCGWHGRVIDTLRDLYKKTTFRIKHRGKLSQAIENLLGVNQGGTASGLLFRKYMQDLSDYLKKEFGVVIGNTILAHLLWADDLILISDSLMGIKKQLKGLMKFCSKNQMMVNAIKTKIMIFGSKEKISIKFNDILIEQVDKYKYVGCIIRSILKYNSDPFLYNYTYLCDQARKALYSVKQKLRNIGQLPPSLMLHVFNTLIRPILTYGSDVWGVNKTGRNSIDKLTLRFLKNILGVKQSTSTLMVIGETGFILPSVDCIRNTVCFHNRITHMDNSFLVREVYDELKNLHECGFPTWFSKAYDILRDNSLEIDISRSNFKQASKDTLINKFKSNWFRQIDNIEEHPILRQYSKFKAQFETESYITKLNNIKYIKALARFRTSSHRLRIETARHAANIIPVEERKCEFCNCNDIEDELHFLVKCHLYQQERRCLYDSLSKRGININHLNCDNQFKFLMTFNDQRHLNELGKYIHFCFLKRKEVLNDIR